ncbi:hypothetical protein Tco_0327292 [Tanacetum coccineum]
MGIETGVCTVAGVCIGQDSYVEKGFMNERGVEEKDDNGFSMKENSSKAGVKSSSSWGMEADLENDYWMIRNIPVVLRKWTPNSNLCSGDLNSISVSTLTLSLCERFMGMSSFARALIDLRVDVDSKGIMVVVVPRLDETGTTLSTIRIEHE